MTNLKLIFLLFVSSMLLSSPTMAEKTASPWGGAKLTPTQYKPQKVVYDIHVQTVKELTSALDRASYLSKITGADPFEQSIVLVLHGHEINFFAHKNYEKHKDLMKRAQSLVLRQFRFDEFSGTGRG